MRSGQRTFNTAKPKAGVNVAKLKAGHNVIKASACWVWMPKNRVGRLNIALIDEDHFGSDGCIGSGEAGVQQGQQRIKKKSRRVKAAAKIRVIQVKAVEETTAV
ncbi:hypothetical protein Tco_1207688 [Tanacetum coccineum]